QYPLLQIAKLDSEAWPGLLDPERDRLILINEKEELLKELQFVRPRTRLEPNDAEKLETQKKRLERDLQAARDSQSKKAALKVPYYAKLTSVNLPCNLAWWLQLLVFMEICLLPYFGTFQTKQ
uniref:WWC1-like helical hairpin domain-containing protein n=1 Tax=Periophthalmus magnuspinnatus TaxID=409849 RepID=A0A3B3ZHF9_9GOBI